MSDQIILKSVGSYVDTNGHAGNTECPHCGSDNLQSDSCTRDRLHATDEPALVQNVTCQNCGATWNDVWRCVGSECFELCQDPTFPKGDEPNKNKGE